jgi:chromosome partitioning protein
MKITIINGKGGVGKSTFTIALGSALAEAGHKVGVIDRDPQKTATHWIERLPNLEIVRTGQKYTSVIIDTPPRLNSNLLHASLRESDVAVLITSPSPADLWTSKDTRRSLSNIFPVL